MCALSERYVHGIFSDTAYMYKILQKSIHVCGNSAQKNKIWAQE